MGVSTVTMLGAMAALLRDAGPDAQLPATGTLTPTQQQPTTGPTPGGPR
jgi:hypothetical protein